MRFYLFTDSEDVADGRLWCAGTRHQVRHSGVFGRMVSGEPRWILGYGSALVGAFLQPLDGAMQSIWPDADPPRQHYATPPERQVAHLWECESRRPLKSFYGLVYGFREAVAVRRVAVPNVSALQRISLAFLCVRHIFKDPHFEDWAREWHCRPQESGAALFKAFDAIQFAEGGEPQSKSAALRVLDAAGFPREALLMPPPMLGPLANPFGTKVERWESARLAAEAMYRAARIRQGDASPRKLGAGAVGELASDVQYWEGLAELAVEQWGGLGSGRSPHDEPALFGAVRTGDLEKISVLLATADAEAKTGALYLAVEKNHGPMAELLLASGAGVNGGEEDWWTPLHLAADRGYPGIARLLLRKGAARLATDREGKTPRDRAVERHHSEIADLLRLP